MPVDIAPLTYGTFYHTYNRGNNRENIIVQERNYLRSQFVVKTYLAHRGSTRVLSSAESFPCGVHKNKEDLSSLKQHLGV